MDAAPSSAVWTVPNALTFLRLALLPLFLWLALAQDALGWAFSVGVLGLATDIADGRIARRSGTITRLGTLLDPLADRLWFGAVVAVILVHELAWPPLVWAIVLRDVVLVVFGVTFLKATGRAIPPVTRLGKRASFLVSVGLGTFLLAGAVGSADTPHLQIQTAAYAILWVALALYLVSFADYVRAGLQAPRVR